MKKIFYILSILLVANFVEAQTGIGTTTPAVKLHVKSNAATFRLEGTDHTYMELFPQGSTTRYGYIGFPNASSTQLTFMNQFATGPIVFGTNGSNKMFLSSDGKLSIGTSTPASTLTVGAADGSVAGEITLNPTETTNEGGQIAIKRSLSGGTVDWTIDHYGTTSANARFRIFSGTTETNGINILENGNVGIGTNAPTVRLQVNGDIIANSIGGSSDFRFKTNIRPVTNALDKIKALRGVYFNWNQNDYPDRQFGSNIELGFIAQEVEKIIPEIVTKDKTKDEFRSIKYDKLVALLVEAIKEQQKQIDSLKFEVKRKINKK
jgi:DNA-directed RNA polymerase subunit L